MYNDYYAPYEEPSVWPYYVFAFAVITIVAVIVGVTVREGLTRLSPDLQTLQPDQVWLVLIPFFGTFWIFYIIWHLSGGLKEEFKRRNIVEFETSPGLGIGWAFAFLMLTTQLVALIGTTVLTIILAVITVALMIIFLVRLSGFRSKLDLTRPTSFEPHHQYSIPPPQWPVYPPPPPQQFDPPPSSYQPPQNPSGDDLDRWRPK